MESTHFQKRAQQKEKELNEFFCSETIRKVKQPFLIQLEVLVTFLGAPFLSHSSKKNKFFIYLPKIIKYC